MVRAPYFDKDGIKKGAWSEEEDKRLIAYVQRNGHPNWRQLPKFAGLARCGKSCRLRWMNYLRPNLKRGNYTQKEEQIITELHKKYGNKWSLIAENLPGRTDNEIKNYWHSHLKKISRRNNLAKSKELKSNGAEFEGRTTSEGISDNSHQVLERSLSMSSETSYNEENHAESRVTLSRELEESIGSWENIVDGFGSSFWTEPFISENAIIDDYLYFPVSCNGTETDEPFFLW